MQRATSAQLVTSFDPNAVPLTETTIDRAIMQWSSLDHQAQADALMIVTDESGDRHVYGRTRIIQLVGAG